MPPIRTLITGVCGFTGRHLVARLKRDRNRAIFGLDTSPTAEPFLDDYFACDLTDASAVNRAIDSARPDLVIHLAGLIGAAPAARMHEVNVGGFASLCAALRRAGRGSNGLIRLVALGSAAEIGAAGARRLPVAEDVCCVPANPYGQSKLAITRLALAEPPDSPLRIIVARPFNLIGPGLGAQLALGNFVRQIAAVARGEAEAVHCGPLEARRDFVDVRDAVDAYVRLAERGRSGQIYNVCAGCSFRIGDLLERLIAIAGVTPRIIVQPSPRAGDLPDLYGAHDKLTRETGWRPTFSMEQSLADLWMAARTQSAEAA